LSLLRVEGAEEPVPARRLLGMGERQRAAWRAESNLVGRRWEMAAVKLHRLSGAARFSAA
jgi:adenylate cyclase